MPKYLYNCITCEQSIELIHSYGIIPCCPICSGSLSRDYAVPFNILKGDAPIRKVGDLTKQFIEDNRQVLRELKEEKKKC